MKTIEDSSLTKLEQLETALKQTHKRLDKNIHKVTELEQKLDQIETSRSYKTYGIFMSPVRLGAKLSKRTINFGLKTTKKVVLKSDFLMPIAERSARILKPYLKFHNGSLGKKILATTLAKRRDDRYQKWLINHYPTKEQLKKQTIEGKKFSYKPLISIVVPTYNTPKLLLKEMLESVIAQSYPNWELCIADDASTDEQVQKTIKHYAQKDKRIKYIIRLENGHDFGCF